MVFMSLRLKRACARLRMPSAMHIVRLVFYFVLCELLGLYLTAYLQLPSVPAVILSFVIGLVGGWLSYRQTMRFLDFYEHSDHDSSQNPPQIPGDGEN